MDKQSHGDDATASAMAAVLSRRAALKRMAALVLGVCAAGSLGGCLSSHGDYQSQQYASGTTSPDPRYLIYVSSRYEPPSGNYTGYTSNYSSNGYSSTSYGSSYYSNRYPSTS